MFCAPLPLVLGVGVGGEQEEDLGEQEEDLGDPPPNTPPSFTYRTAFGGKLCKFKWHYHIFPCFQGHRQSEHARCQSKNSGASWLASCGQRRGISSSIFGREVDEKVNN